ncbi:hypothetical protein EDEG_02109 [Edhazardia aedis USNM 41457]|uniref:Uncharacterized protein n=1 Tax=Edhazardia aedis (strain USNM 41457) TaxID=1003232 RepID=J9DQI5_EDHAE|nr:hypothetical protein EDEG_02109 [Edhazardia aedis USNM 41457]|eukprot:EJW03567.1 hypothetical protein EDEG_02109 [Edhazardia aedis USNM 41457]
MKFKFQRNLPNYQKTCYLFLDVILSLPDDILNYKQKLFYFKICKLQDQLTSHLTGQNDIKMDFFICLKYNCSFELTFDARNRFEYYIDRALFTTNRINIYNKGNEKKYKSEIQRLKNIFFSILARNGFKIAVYQMFKANIQKLGYILGEKGLNGEQLTNTFIVYF